jgi:SAM-dependent methyltransferase
MSYPLFDKKRMYEFYIQSLKDYGPNDPRSVHWLNLYTQTERFRILSQVGNLQGTSILDAGCGYGDLYAYLKNNDIETHYTGIDIMPEFIKVAQKRFPTLPFEVKDMFDIQEEYDYILSSGSLSFKIDNYQAYYFSLIRHMFDHARIAVAFNMLDAKNHPNDELYAAYYPEQVEAYCRTFCSNVKVITDYLDNDFTIFLYKLDSNA